MNLSKSEIVPVGKEREWEELGKFLAVRFLSFHKNIRVYL